MSTINETVKLKRQITIYVVASLTVISIIVASISLIPLYLNSRDQAHKELSNMLGSRKMAVEEYLSKVENIASQVTSRSQIRRQLEKYNRRLISKSELVNFTSPKLIDAMIHSPGISGICRLDSKGYPVVEVGFSIPQALKNSYTSPLENIQISMIKNQNNFCNMLVAAPILDRDKKPVGTDLVLFELAELRQIINDSSNMGNSAELVLISKTGSDYQNIFSEKSVDNYIKCLSNISSVNERDNSFIKIYDFEGKEQAIACTGFGKIPCFLIMSIDKDELYLPVRQTTFSTAGIIIFFVILGSIGIIFILRPLTGRMLVQVEDMEKQINLLSGMIPICANCKNIRNDEGYWNRIEEYLEANSEIKFSHSLCPACVEELYGEEEWYKKGFGKDK